MVSSSARTARAVRSRPTTRILPALALTQPLRVASSGLEKRLCPEANRGLAGCWKLDFRGVVGRAPVFMLRGFISSYLVANILGTWDLIGLGWTEKAGPFAFGSRDFLSYSSRRWCPGARPPTRRPTPSTFDHPLSFKKSTTGSLCSVCLSAVLLPPSSGIRSFFPRKAFFLVGGRKPVTRFSFSPHPQPRTQEEDHGGRIGSVFQKVQEMFLPEHFLPFGKLPC